MTNFLTGKIKVEQQTDSLLFNSKITNNIYDNIPRQFSKEATAVFNSGRELGNTIMLKKT